MRNSTAAHSQRRRLQLRLAEMCDEYAAASIELYNVLGRHTPTQPRKVLQASPGPARTACPTSFDLIRDGSFLTDLLLAYGR